MWAMTFKSVAVLASLIVLYIYIVRLVVYSTAVGSIVTSSLCGL